MTAPLQYLVLVSIPVNERVIKVLLAIPLHPHLIARPRGTIRTAVTPQLSSEISCKPIPLNFSATFSPCAAPSSLACTAILPHDDRRLVPFLGKRVAELFLKSDPVMYGTRSPARATDTSATPRRRKPRQHRRIAEARMHQRPPVIQPQSEKIRPIRPPPFVRATPSQLRKISSCTEICKQLRRHLVQRRRHALVRKIPVKLNSPSGVTLDLLFDHARFGESASQAPRGRHRAQKNPQGEQAVKISDDVTWFLLKCNRRSVSPRVSQPANTRSTSRPPPISPRVAPAPAGNGRQK